MMAFIWVVWTSVMRGIFNHKANSILSLLDCALFLVNFWAGNVGLPIKKVDVSIILVRE